MEAECTAFKEGFIGTAEEICGRTSGKHTQSRKKKEQWGGTRKLNKQYKKEGGTEVCGRSKRRRKDQAEL